MQFKDLSPSCICMFLLYLHFQSEATQINKRFKRWKLIDHSLSSTSGLSNLKIFTGCIICILMGHIVKIKVCLPLSKQFQCPAINKV